MAIGIGLHCCYCEHGPCDGTCREKVISKEQIRDDKIKKILSNTADPEEAQAMEDFLRKYFSIKK